MRILSIDVGIKNLAYCLIDSSNNENINILDWKIINLCNTEKKCIFNTNKNIICNKNATFYINDEYYCNVHAKKVKYLIPDNTIKKYNKLKLDGLIEFCNKYNIIHNSEINKTNILKDIKLFLENNLLKKIVKEPTNNMSLVKIGISLKNEIDKNINISELDSVVIENQIGPIANKMKCIQCMIAQYFIMKNMNNIHFISASNKLKKYIGDIKTNYSERKKLSINITNELLIKYKLYEWVEILKQKKSDDLADSFLQGLWYLESIC